MADIDKELIGQVLHSIDYAEVFGTPLAAAVDVQTKAANSALNFIMSVGFTTDEKTGLKKTTYAEFEFEETDGTGQTQTRKLRLPLITIIRLPQLEITDGTVSFDLEISQSAEVKDHLEAGGEASAQVGWGPFSVSFKAKASYSRDTARKTDTRARQHVELNIKQAEPPEAINMLLEIMRDSAMGARSGTSQGSIKNKSGGSPTPTPAPSPAPSPDPDKKK